MHYEFNLGSATRFRRTPTVQPRTRRTLGRFAACWLTARVPGASSCGRAGTRAPQLRQRRAAPISAPHSTHVIRSPRLTDMVRCDHGSDDDGDEPEIGHNHPGRPPVMGEGVSSPSPIYRYPRAPIADGLPLCMVNPLAMMNPGRDRRAAQRPYQFNCTFRAWHPETGGANRSEPERAGDPARRPPSGPSGPALSPRPWGAPTSGLRSGRSACISDGNRDGNDGSHQRADAAVGSPLLSPHLI